MTEFEVWAPDARRVEAEVSGRLLPMSPGDGGWWRTEAAAAGDGTRYAFRLDGGPPLPDPRSRRQPDGPDGASAVVEHERFRWRHAWEGRG
ncbi:malto-oligosyltrehalose trehalohydrolase, partial [Streptomyces sp. A7024]|nr:malto-oligosyltrehalose trehalohydrolase [Streptomyces coryli]